MRAKKAKFLRRIAMIAAVPKETVYEDYSPPEYTKLGGLAWFKTKLGIPRVLAACHRKVYQHFKKGS